MICITNKYSGKKQSLRPVGPKINHGVSDVDSWVDRLRFGILRQAVQDYIKALKANEIREAENIELFFLSDWGQLLSDYNGELIIDVCRRKAKEGK